MELKIHDNFQIVDINSITIDPENAKRHTTKDIEEKKASLKLHGFVKPLAVSKDSMTISAGNGIYLAAKELGYKKVPVIFTDHTALRAKSYGLSDNRLSETSGYDLEQFNLIIKELAEYDKEIDWNALAFDQNEIELLLASINTEISDSSNGLTHDNDQESLKDFDEADQPGKQIKMTKGQREIFDLAARKIKEADGDNKLSDGKIVELLAADFLSGRS